MPWVISQSIFLIIRVLLFLTYDRLKQDRRNEEKSKIVVYYITLFYFKLLLSIIKSLGSTENVKPSIAISKIYLILTLKTSLFPDTQKHTTNKTKNRW